VQLAALVAVQRLDPAAQLREFGARHRRRDRRRAGARRRTVDVNRAGAALSDAAAEFSTGQAGFLTDGPQQRHFGFDVERMALSVD
jgi:hypothetical protein